MKLFSFCICAALWWKTSCQFVTNSAESVSGAEELNFSIVTDRLISKYGTDGTIDLKGWLKMEQNLLSCSRILVETPAAGSRSDSHSHEESSRTARHIEEDFGYSSTSSKVVASEWFKLGYNATSRVSGEQFVQMCILRLYSFDHDCEHVLVARHHNDSVENSSKILTSIWLYASLSVTLMSACGLLGVAVVPLMKRNFYQQLLHFLVALAIGSLSGDALIHLLPHAMLPGDGAHHHHHHQSSLLKGTVASLAVIVFFSIEQCIGFFGWERRHKKGNGLKLVPLNNACPRNAKVCKHVKQNDKGDLQRENDYNPVCSRPSNNPPHHPIQSGERCRSEGGREYALSAKPVKLFAVNPLKDFSGDGKKKKLENLEETETDKDASLLYERADMLAEDKLVNEKHAFQNASSHGHAHYHGHVHTPEKMSAVAWMVIVGDGLHNLCDGLALGAAFITSIPVGFSTSIAVFCHELPHEIGDFAMLLKTGMSVSHAVMYNIISSVVSYVGMVIGILLGGIQLFSSWLMAIVAGIFLYISLVDMVSRETKALRWIIISGRKIPELSSRKFRHSVPTFVFRLFLQIFGMLVGVAIMLVIALFESDMHTLLEY